MKQSERRAHESISNFIEKTYNILQNLQNQQIISWTLKGLSFIIKDIKKFQQHILPIYFKHSNFSSFVRQLNMYNFHKVRGDKFGCEFQHIKFKKGHKQLLAKIKRKQSQNYIISHLSIEQIQGIQCIQDESQNIKKQSQPAIQSQKQCAIKHESSVIRNECFVQQVEQIRKQNKLLRTIKQNKLQKHKVLSSCNPLSIGQKFFKLTTCLFAQKIKKQLKLQHQSYNNVEEEYQKNFSFDQIIEHILNSSYGPLQFYKYSSTAKTISNQQSDFDFMIGKANTNLFNTNGVNQIGFFNNGNTFNNQQSQ